MPSESRQKWLERNRKPRVHITMDVETGGAHQKVELPFIVGVLGDFSGHPEPGDVKPLRDRKFVSIDRDNFDKVLKGIKPRLQIRVENTLTGEGEIPVELSFESMEDFNPAKIAERVEPLRQLLETRKKLLELQTHVDRSPELEELLGELLQDKAKIERASQQMGGGEAPAPSSDGGDAPSEEPNA